MVPQWKKEEVEEAEEEVNKNKMMDEWQLSNKSLQEIYHVGTSMFEFLFFTYRSITRLLIEAS